MNEQVKKYELGADCEDLMCAACGAVVEEFGKALLREVENPRMEYVHDVAPGFCGSKEIRSKYGEIVETICKTLFDDESTGHMNVMLRRFEETADWDHVASLANIHHHQKAFCVDSMICKPSFYQFKSEATVPDEEGWTKECFTCQAIAGHLEIQSGLYSNLKDPNVIVREACDRMRLPKEYDVLCRNILSESRIDEIGWLVKVHHEAVAKHTSSAEKFPTYMCGEIKQCVRQQDEEENRQVEIDAPFF